jgi:hypothetical protein
MPIYVTSAAIAMPLCVMNDQEPKGLELFLPSMISLSPRSRGTVLHTSREAFTMGLLGALVVVPMILGHHPHQAPRYLDIGGVKRLSPGTIRDLAQALTPA